MHTRPEKREARPIKEEEEEEGEEEDGEDERLKKTNCIKKKLLLHQFFSVSLSEGSFSSLSGRLHETNSAEEKKIPQLRKRREKHSSIQRIFSARLRRRRKQTLDLLQKVSAWGGRERGDTS